MLTKGRTDGLGQAQESPLRLDYRIAFDLAASWLERNAAKASRTVLVATSTTFVDEWLLRVPGSATILTQQSSILAAGPNPILLSEPYRNDSTGKVPPRFSSIAWASPQRMTWRIGLSAIDGALDVPGRLAVIVPGRLNWLLVSFVQRAPLSGAPLPVDELRRVFRYRGFRLEGAYGIGGLDSAGWAALNRIATLADRPNLADRCEAGYRLALAPRRNATLTTLRLLFMRKDTEKENEVE